MKTQMKGIRIPLRGVLAVAAIAVVAPAVTGCSDARVTELAAASVTMPAGAAYGAPVPVGNGSARAYVVTRADDVVEVGVSLTEGAMEGLPTGEGHVHTPGGMPFMAHFDLEMPVGNVTPYRFIGLGWNPAGHEPPGIYDTPHFDFHFYTISPAERDAIVPSDPAYVEKGGDYPASDRIPAGYLDLATLGGMDVATATVPTMGMHWADTRSPELNGEAFTETFLYGTWAGEVIFAEPMITRAFLQTKPDFRRALPTPAVGYAPAEYRIYWSEETGEYRVALTGFDRREQTTSRPAR